MKLPEKILELRKRRGLSQEALAEELGVSRQAISKWENGDATPEIFKLRLIAATFGVTIDWLLSDEGFTETSPNATESWQDHENNQAFSPGWIDHLPLTLANLVKRFGWLAGIYVMLAGLGPVLIGMLSIFITNKMFAPSEMDSFFTEDLGSPEMLITNPVAIMGKFMIGIGLILLMLGLILTIVLRKWGRRKAQAEEGNLV